MKVIQYHSKNDDDVKVLNDNGLGEITSSHLDIDKAMDTIFI